MSTLTFGQLESLLIARGATPQEADVGAAIAEAESGGRTEAHGDQSLPQGSGQYVGSLGPWQIFGSAHPTVTAGCAQDPGCAADQVKAISSDFTNWNPWTTFRTGAYAQFLASPSDFMAGGVASVPSGSGDQLLASRSNTPAWAQALGVSDMGDLFLRGGVGIAGAVLIIIGLLVLFRSGPVIRTVATGAALGAAGL